MVREPKNKEGVRRKNEREERNREDQWGGKETHKFEGGREHQGGDGFETQKKFLRQEEVGKREYEKRTIFS